MSAPITFLDGRVTLHVGDCRDVIGALADNSIDAVVTDPPYALTGASRNGSPRNNDPETPFGRTKLGERGFMGKTWDTGETAFAVEFWAEVFRVLKPGGHVVAFSGTRTYHRLACAIEDAGFEIRDMIDWLYGSGFPKSHNLRGDMEGWGTALKPAKEPMVLARKWFEGTVAANVQKYGTGALNIDAARIDASGAKLGGGPKDGKLKRSRGWDRPWMHDDDAASRARARSEASVEKAETLGRWPANVVHDGSDEVVSLFPDSDGQQGDVRGNEPSGVTNKIYGTFNGRMPSTARLDSGSAARFFYCAKAGARDRAGSKHPTVKPIRLMQWLVKLITPPGGTVLDPFAGTGTTGEAAWLENFNAVLIEREAVYVEDIKRRMETAASPMARKAISGREKIKRTTDDGDLFDEAAK